MADEESYLSKANKFMRSITGADEYDRTRERAREKVKSVIGEKGATALDNASEALSYAELGMMGKAGKVKKAAESAEKAVAGVRKSRPAIDYQSSGSLRRKFLERADKGEIKAAKPTVARKPRPGEKNFIGPTNKPMPGDKKFIGPTRPPKAGEKGFIGPRRPPKAGDSDFIGPVRKKSPLLDKRAKITVGAGVAAAGAGLGYKAAQKSNAEEKRNFGNRVSGTTFAKGKGTASAPKKEPSSEPKGDLKTPKINKAAPTAGGQDFKSKMQGRNWQGSEAKKAPSGSASDKSKAAGKTAKQVVHGGSRGMTFQEAVRRNRSDEWLKERIRPKKNLLDLFKKKR